MKTYRLSAEAIEKYSKPRTLLYGIVGVLLAITLLLSVWTNLSGGRGNWLLLVINTVIFGYATIAVLIFARNQHKTWASYEIGVGEDSIAYRFSPLKSPVVLRREAVKRIQKIEGGGIIVAGNGRRETVLVSPILDEFEEIAAQLRKWKEFEVVSQFRTYAIAVIFSSALLTALMILNLRPSMIMLSLPWTFLFTSLLVVVLIASQFARDKGLRLLSLLYLLPLVVLAIKLWELG